VRQEREIALGRVLPPSRQARERCADFTARRIASALANLDGASPAYVESGGV
jgi:hypothetical protein